MPEFRLMYQNARYFSSSTVLCDPFSSQDRHVLPEVSVFVSQKSCVHAYFAASQKLDHLRCCPWLVIFFSIRKNILSWARRFWLFASSLFSCWPCFVFVYLKMKTCFVHVLHSYGYVSYKRFLMHLMKSTHFFTCVKIVLENDRDKLKFAFLCMNFWFIVNPSAFISIATFFENEDEKMFNVFFDSPLILK